MQSKNIVAIILVLVLISAFGYLYMNSEDEVVTNEQDTSNNITEPVETITDEEIELPEEVTQAERGSETVIGSSNSGNDITAYHFGEGDTEILLIGGVHGGYSWNTTVLGYEIVDYFDANPNLIPDNLTVTVIPVMNPDGLKETVGTVGRFDASDALAVSEATRTEGRFNTNNVDLNRNFDCEWSETGTWRSQEVSGGNAPFSEPEALAVRDYVKTYQPAAAVVWFSAEGKVYPSACEGAPSQESIELAATFASAAGYDAAAEFNAYNITGDMVNWMADQKIPAISVLLTDHKNSEETKNLAGIQAVIKAYTK